MRKTGEQRILSEIDAFYPPRELSIRVQAADPGIVQLSGKGLGDCTVSIETLRRVIEWWDAGRPTQEGYTRADAIPARPICEAQIVSGKGRR